MANVSTLEKRGIDWNGGNEPFKASWGKLMMWFFLVSDAFSFSGLLITYGFIRYNHTAYEPAVHGAFKFSLDYWPLPDKVFEAIPFAPHGFHAPLVFVGIMTFILIMSSVTMVLAVEAGHRRDRKDVEKWMLWTILGGATFLGSQAWEWAHFIHGTADGATDIYGNVIHGANLIQNQYGPVPFANLFFFITGFHGTHVFSGVVINILIFYNVSIGMYDRPERALDAGAEPYEMVEKIGLYWHFVDLVWVFVFTAFYLI